MWVRVTPIVALVSRSSERCRQDAAHVSGHLGSAQAGKRERVRARMLKDGGEPSAGSRTWSYVKDQGSTTRRI